MSAALETIARGDSSLIAVARRVIVRNPVEWRALWAAHAGPQAAEPAIDFGARMVAAVFAGERPSASYGITIAEGREEAGALVLVVDESRPAEDEAAAQIITSPFHIVALPRHDGRVEFVNAANPSDDHALASLGDLQLDRSRRGSVPLATGRRRHDPAPSSTGLAPNAAGALAYLAGPFSGALLLATERTSRFVKFHAWQALLGLGTLLLVAIAALVLAFALLVVSATAFWTMLWVAALTSAVWIAVWCVCLFQAYHGRLWKMPLLGTYAERRSGIR